MIADQGCPANRPQDYRFCFRTIGHNGPHKDGDGEWDDAVTGARAIAQLRNDLNWPWRLEE